MGAATPAAAPGATLCLTLRQAYNTDSIEKIENLSSAVDIQAARVACSEPVVPDGKEDEGGANAQ